FYADRTKERSLAKLGEISRRIAHDIRSPLSGLRIIGDSIVFKSPEQEQVFKSSLARIDSIANDVLKMHLSPPANTPSNSSNFSVNSCNEVMVRTEGLKIEKAIEEVCQLK